MLRAIKASVLLAFFIRVALCRYWDIDNGPIDLEIDVNDSSVEFPNLISQKEREGVSSSILKLFVEENSTP